MIYTFTTRHRHGIDNWMGARNELIDAALKCASQDAVDLSYFSWDYANSTATLYVADTANERAEIYTQLEESGKPYA